MKPKLTCDAAKPLIEEDRKGRLAKDRREAVDEHLAACASCRRLRDAEALLDDALLRLPRDRAPAKLRSLVAKGALQASPGPKRSEPQIDSSSDSEPRLPNALSVARPRISRAPWAGIGVVVAFAAAVFLMVRFVGTGVGDGSLVREAVNDHLRVLYSEHPIEIESGGIHQVKPWFAGRVDFAPALAYAGDDEFVLSGGSIAYLIDRKAAVFHFRHKLHQISLFVFRAEGLPWPNGTEPIGRAHAHVETTRGFHVVTWQDGDLGYALVSDVDPAELHRLAERIVDPPPAP